MLVNKQYSWDHQKIKAEQLMDGLSVSIKPRDFRYESVNDTFPADTDFQRARPGAQGFREAPPTAIATTQY